MTHKARQYLAPVYATFWQWKDNGEVIAWMDGKTIAFRSEIHQILRRLAPSGLPPFGSVVLLLAATRDNWQDTWTEPGILSGIIRGGGDGPGKVLTEVLGGLDKISMLDPQLRTGTVAREVLVEMFFEGLKDRGSAETARQVVDMLDRGLGEDVLYPLTSTFDLLAIASNELLRELHALRQGIHRVQADALKSRLATGLDELPEAVDLELGPAQRVRALLATMRNDDELRGLANLAIKLMAAVTLPRNVSDRDDMPLGGFSDIANRGPLDRLLLSELAYDDLTLAVRVAVNEAMYLRRESPPKTPPRHRKIFLEAGIRSWGVPRVFSTAVALALVASVDNVVAYRAKGRAAEPVDLTTRAGLESHLAALEPDVHPGEALAAFNSTMSGADDASEPILVTTEDVLADPEFQRAMAREAMEPLLVATVTRDGAFRLLERTSRGTRQLRDARFALDELFDQPQRTVPTLIDRDWARDLPAILSVRPFPLLLPHKINANRMWRVEGKGLLTLSNDRRLMLWTEARQGAKQLSDEIPKGGLWWASRDADRVQAVVGPADPRRLHLLEIDLTHERCAETKLALDEGLRAICSHNGALFAVYDRKVQVYDEGRGEVRDFDVPLKSTHQRGRFFRSSADQRWYALSFDGINAQFETVPHTYDARCPKLQTMFDKDGVDGPIGVTERGDLYWTATGDLRKVAHRLTGPRVEAISSSGHRLVLSGLTYGRQVVDVDLRSAEPCSGSAIAAAENSGRYFRPVSLRTRFSFICIDDHGVLTLTSRKRRKFAIDYDPANKRICLRPNDGCRVRGRTLTFKQLTTSRRIGYRLTVATWDNGSRAFLDSRGLLHLQSCDTQAVPEATIVLCDRELSGWCSDGKLWGTTYFTGDRQTAVEKDVYQAAIRGFTERAL